MNEQQTSGGDPAGEDAVAGTEAFDLRAAGARLRNAIAEEWVAWPDWKGKRAKFAECLRQFASEIQKVDEQEGVAPRAGGTGRDKEN